MPSIKDKIVLGIHYGHDATVCLIKNGEIIEVMSEERLSRQKKHCGFPLLSLKYIKDKYKIDKFVNVMFVGMPEFMDDSMFKTLDDNQKVRQNKSYTQHYLRSLGIRFPLIGKVIVIRDYFRYKFFKTKSSKKYIQFLQSFFPEAEINYIRHHEAHAFATIPFMKDHKRRVIFTIDGAGDGESGSISIYEDGKINKVSSWPIHSSLGLLYCGIVDILGMARNEHEFKVMGLAPYAKVSSGEKVYEKLKNLIWWNGDKLVFESAFPLEKSTEYLIANEYFNHRFDSIAYGIQKLTETLIVQMVKSVIEKFDCYNIAIGGGVFMNVKANQKVLELNNVKDMTISPSCGDESLAIGAAIKCYIERFGIDDIKQVKSIYWGSEYTDKEIGQAIDNYYKSDSVSKSHLAVKIKFFEKVGEIEKEIARLLSENEVVGRFNSRAEWGARALGNRSILANPSSKDNIKLINEMIKNRDFWMPFATSIKYESVEKYLKVETLKDRNTNYFAPYMAVTFETKSIAEKDIIAALHPYDLTSRPQMVTKEYNHKYWNVIDEFEKITGIGAILNTSFNLHGEPNVETPFDAIRTFDLSGMRYLAIGNYIISKN